MLAREQRAIDALNFAVGTLGPVYKTSFRQRRHKLYWEFYDHANSALGSVQSLAISRVVNDTIQIGSFIFLARTTLQQIMGRAAKDEPGLENAW